MGIQLGTLGRAETFAGQATEVLVRGEAHAIDDVTYFPSVTDVWDALQGGKVDAVVLGAVTQRTGYSPALISWIARDGAWLNDEVVVPYQCVLFGKPGSRIEDIKVVTGHGSLLQCGEYLDSNLPNAERVVHDNNSVAAAEEVAAGDGSTAVIGTRSLGRSLGLIELASDVDGGAKAAWWLLGTSAEYADEPDHLAILLRHGDNDNGLGRLIAAASAAGLSVRGIYAAPTQRALFETDSLVLFQGKIVLADALSMLDDLPDARLVGAFSK